MNHKKILGIIFGFALISAILGVLSEPGSLNLGCANNGLLCNNRFVAIEGELFLLLSVPFFILCPILFFLRREVFLAWAKFAAVGFPLMFGLLLYVYNNEPQRGIMGFVITDEEMAAILLPPLFVILSLLIIGGKWWKTRR